MTVSRSNSPDPSDVTQSSDNRDSGNDQIHSEAPMQSDAHSYDNEVMDINALKLLKNNSKQVKRIRDRQKNKLLTAVVSLLKAVSD